MKKYLLVMILVTLSAIVYGQSITAREITNLVSYTDEAISKMLANKGYVFMNTTKIAEGSIKHYTKDEVEYVAFGGGFYDKNGNWKRTAMYSTANEKYFLSVIENFQSMGLKGGTTSTDAKGDDNYTMYGDGYMCSVTVSSTQGRASSVFVSQK